MELFSKARFQQAYQIALKERSPKEYRRLMREKRLKDHIQETTEAAWTMYMETERRLREEQGMALQSKFIAAEIVFAEMLPS